MLDVADVILTLMTLEITSLKNVRVFMESRREARLRRARRCSSSRTETTAPAASRRSDVEASLGRKIPHTIVSDGRTLVLAVNRGVPFVISHRDSQVAKDIFTLAQKVAQADSRPGRRRASKRRRAADSSSSEPVRTAHRPLVTGLIPRKSGKNPDWWT